MEAEKGQMSMWERDERWRENDSLGIQTRNRYRRIYVKTKDDSGRTLGSGLRNPFS